MAMRVGIVGMGLMGQAFILNLRKSDFSIQGFDTDPARMDDLQKIGGEPVDSPAAAARGVKWVITSLPNSGIVREAALGAGGIVEGAREGLYLIDTTTSRPEDSERIADELARSGIHFLDAAVSGTSTMARAKDLIVIAGGKKEDFEACRPVFEGFSRAAYHMGPVGSGARTKLVVNLILGGNRLALAEGLVLGEKAGLELKSLLSVLQDGACSSKTMIDKGPKMIDADYTRQGQIKTALKDSRLMIEQGQRLGAPLLLTNIWSQLLQTAYEKGYAEKDSVAFIEILRGMAGLTERAGIDDEPFGQH
ncbi:MAG: NAD(P)-dependent oxidoreductase [Thermodesulfobacteriota bacterium]